MLPALAAVNGKQQSPQPGRLQVPAGRGHFFAAGSPQRGTMAERKQRRWLAKRAGLLLFVCRGRKAAGQAVRVPSRDFRKRQKRRGSLFPWNLFFGALEGTLPRPCGQSAGLSAPAGTPGGRKGCSSPFRRFPETTKKKRFLVSLEPLLWCSGTFGIRTFWVDFRYS